MGGLEFALDPGVTGEMYYAMRVGDLIITSGTLSFHSTSIRPSGWDMNGATGQLLIKSGATLKGGTDGFYKGSQTAMNTFRLEDGATWEIPDYNITMSAQTVNLWGTVVFNAAGNQFFPSSGGRTYASPITNFNNIILDKGVKSLVNDISINGSLTQLNGASLNLNGFRVDYPDQGEVPDYLEYQALKDLYQSTHGEAWTDDTNWLNGTNSEDFANWYGVTVENGDVTAINFFDNNLDGEIPFTIGNLTSLWDLSLSFNNLKGSIPESIGSLQKLEWLLLGNNQLNGILPKTIGNLSNLYFLSLRNNELEGELPYEIGNLHNLSTLDIQYNHFSGPIPNSFGTLYSITDFTASHNGFTSLPNVFLDLQYLSNIDLSHNELANEVPSTLFLFPDVQKINFQSNHLKGEIPITDIAHLDELEILNLSDNELTNGVPEILGSINTLKVLNLGDNHFSGNIPDHIFQNENLENLCLNDNELEGAIPISIDLAASLKVIDLKNNNNLNGEIPFGITLLENLETLYLSDNNFTSFPDFSSKLNSKTLSVFVDGNNLNFEELIPNFVGEDTHVFEYFDYKDQKSGSDVHLYFILGERIELRVTDQAQYNHYQWQKNINGTWQDIASATSIGYVVSSVTATDAGEYRCTVTNDWITDITMYSQPFVVEVLENLAENSPNDELPPVVEGSNAPDPEAAQCVRMQAEYGCVLNYVRVYTPRIEIKDEVEVINSSIQNVLVSTDYLDGLGATLQTVIKQESPGGKDVVLPKRYHALGRAAKEYLPYTVSPDNSADPGDYRQNALQEQYDFYHMNGDDIPNTDFPYSEVEYFSTLNDIATQAAPGESWEMSSGHAIKLNKKTNDLAIEGIIYRWKFNESNGLPEYNGFYVSGALNVTETRDERGYLTVEIKKQKRKPYSEKSSGGRGSW